MGSEMCIRDRSEREYLKVIAENTDSNHVLYEIDSRLSQLEHEMRLAVDYLRDIAIAVSGDD